MAPKCCLWFARKGRHYKKRNGDVLSSTEEDDSTVMSAHFDSQLEHGEESQAYQGGLGLGAHEAADTASGQPTTITRAPSSEAGPLDSEDGTLDIDTSEVPDRVSLGSPSSDKEIQKKKSDGLSVNVNNVKLDFEDDEDKLTDSHDPPHINGLAGAEKRYLRAVNYIVQPDNWAAVSAFRKYNVKAYYHHVGGDAESWIWMAFEINQPLDVTMSLGNELELWPKWNKVCPKNEALIEPTQYEVNNRWLRSIAHGLYCTDTLNNITRFVNHDQGFYLEHIYPIDEKSPYWAPATKGHHREKMESALMLMPIKDGNSTLWISMTQTQFPVSMNNWMARNIIPTVSREIACSVLQGCEKISHPKDGAPWRAKIAEDKLGVYAELRKLKPQSFDIDNLPTFAEAMMWKKGVTAPSKENEEVHDKEQMRPTTVMAMAQEEEMVKSRTAKAQAREEERAEKKEKKEEGSHCPELQRLRRLRLEALEKDEEERLEWKEEQRLRRLRLEALEKEEQRLRKEMAKEMAKAKEMAAKEMAKAKEMEKMLKEKELAAKEMAKAMEIEKMLKEKELAAKEKEKEESLEIYPEEEKREATPSLEVQEAAIAKIMQNGYTRAEIMEQRDGEANHLHLLYNRWVRVLTAYEKSG